MTRATDEDGGGVMPEPTLSDDELVIEALVEVLREPGARLAGDSQFFSKTVGPLYARYGEAAVSPRCGRSTTTYGAERRPKSVRMNAGALKREISRRRHHCEEHQR